ncbi:hypothetical protein M0R45_036007 [Rubus argutus]|uniref:Uncharacterized protein n=1 Tax=Rubus argutus TaxID=59490 RepID=A0AAW1VUS6_RUBAR
MPSLKLKEEQNRKIKKRKLPRTTRTTICQIRTTTVFNRDAQNSRMPPATSNPSRRRLHSDVPNPCSSIDAASATVAPLPPSP